MKPLGASLRRSLCLAGALSAAACIFACISEKDPGTGEGPSTDVGNPKLSGTLVGAGGKPAPGRVKLFLIPPAIDPASEDTLPPIAPVFRESSAVGADGRFAFDSLPPGRYALEGSDGSRTAFAWIGGLALTGPGDTLIRDLRLAPPARIRGRVTRGANPRPAGVRGDENILVRLAGADRAARTDSAGDFALTDVPAGTYRLAFSSPDGHYLTRYLDGVAAAAGADTLLRPIELEWSPYGPPPAVGGIAIAIDSAAGVARLSWRPARLGGGAGATYAILRGGAEIGRGADTAFIDSLAGVAPGAPLRYAIVAINPLGQAGPADTLPPVPAPRPADPPPGDGVLEGLIIQGNVPVTGARVSLYLAPAAPGLPGSPPSQPILVDSAASDAAGRYRFARLGGAKYAAIALAPDGKTIAAAPGLAPREPGLRADTLRLAAPGTVAGSASRDSLWITSPFKGDERIRASLSGMPCSALTESGYPPAGGPFKLTGVPEGAYTLVVYADPEGYFLADSIPVAVRAGETTSLPAVVKARYNPDAEPPRLATLRVTGATRARVGLAWQPVPRYAPLRGYRVLRLSADLVPLDSSGVIAATAYDDDVSGVAAGTILKYVVRVVSSSGREGPPGGDASANPATITVPAR